ncbi:MAG: hypothetical protein M0R80_26215 [Proteobacteria bacterium]|jgi:hypothetical protein|nr:hypothetical protein [Pseudomonadota bacterium]
MTDEYAERLDVAKSLLRHAENELKYGSVHDALDTVRMVEKILVRQKEMLEDNCG